MGFRFKASLLSIYAPTMDKLFNVVDRSITGYDEVVFSADNYADVKMFLAKEWVAYCRKHNLDVKDDYKAKRFASCGRYLIVNYGTGAYVTDIFLNN